MKTSFIQQSLRLAILAGFTMILASSCKKDDNAPETITEEEAVEVFTQSVSDNSGGLSAQTNEAARVATESSLSCGQTQDTTISKTSAEGAVVTYAYNATITRTLACNSNFIPSTFTFSYVGRNVYDAPRMSSDDNTTAGFTISGIEPAAPNYVFNQSYVRNGTQQSKVRLQRSFSSTLTITTTDVVYNKAAGMISSGSAAIAFEGAVSGGKSISRGATFVFLGNKTGTLTFNNGGSYTISW